MILIIMAVVLAAAGVMLVFSSIEIRKESDIRREYAMNSLEKDPVINMDMHGADFTGDDHVLDADFPDITEDFHEPSGFSEDKVSAEDLFTVNEEEELPHLDVQIIEDDDVALVSAATGTKIHRQEPGRFDNVVFYEDASSLVSRDGSGKPLSTEDFSKLKRLGKGTFRIMKNSFEYSFDKKQFRFDFTRINEITGDRNFILLKTRERSYPLFFMSESNMNFSSSVKDKFRMKK